MKRKCPKCNSIKISENRDYFSCNKCGFLHKKTEKEKILIARKGVHN